MFTKQKVWTLIVLVVLVGVMGVMGKPMVAAENLLANPSFEQGEELGENVPGWRASGYDGSSHVDAEFVINSGGRDGNWGGVLGLGPHHQWVLADQHVPIQADETQAVGFSIWMRADEPLEEVDLVLFLTLSQQGIANAGQVRARFEVGTEWQQYETSLDLLAPGMLGLPLEGAEIRAIVQCYRPAEKLYVDDASLTLVDLDPRLRELTRDCVAPGTEAGLLSLQDGSVAVFLQLGGRIVMRKSRDQGQTWSPPESLRDVNGDTFGGWIGAVLRLPSGAIGMFLNEGERKLFFCRSEDEGQTWSVKRQINDEGQIARMYSGSAIVLATGRIIGPTYTYRDDWYGREHPNTPGPQTGMYCWLSDDEGRTWTTSEEIWLFHEGKRYWFEEGNVVELSDGRVLMLARTPMGRLYKSYSSDRGQTWSAPEPTPLAAAYAPCALAMMPTGDLLCIWNQNSLEEDQQGLRRHRLTCAVSDDDGTTWQHFRNLESLDDTTHIAERPILWDVFRYDHESPYHQPTDLDAYPHAPGVLRCAYPTIAFTEDRGIVAYDYGSGLLPTHFVKVRSLPLQWFYENP